ncbi:MAG: DUF58 domain-containing protein [Pseudomonadota bacterium]
MLRPSRRLLALAVGAFAVSAVALALGGPWRDGALAVWMALGVLVAVDLALSLRGRVAVEVEAPAEIFTGEGGDVTLSASRFPRGLAARVDWPDGLSGPVDLAFQDGGVARTRIEARRRGQYRIGQLWLNWPSRFELLEFTPRAKLDLTVAAVPNIRPVQSGEIDTKVRSTLFGVKENFARGEGSEFHQLRDWVQGMDTRAIDWKQSARHLTLVAKEMRAERNHHVILTLDNGYLMREQVGGLPKIDHAVNAALATAWAAGLGGDLVGLFTYDARPRLFVPPEPGRAAFARLRSRMAELEYESVESNHTLAMAALSTRTPRRSLIVVFSDFVDATTAELLVENVATLARRHVVVFVAIRDPSVEARARAAPGDLDGVAEAVVAGGMVRERQVVMERLARLGIMVIDTEPGAVTPRLIAMYLDLKAREVI